MKKLKLVGKEALTKDQMKNIIGGDWTNCGELCRVPDDYVCCSSTGVIGNLGYWTCCAATEYCSAFMGGYKVTNDPSSCVHG